MREQTQCARFLGEQLQTLSFALTKIEIEVIAQIRQALRNRQAERPCLVFGDRFQIGDPTIASFGQGWG